MDRWRIKTSGKKKLRRHHESKFLKSGPDADRGGMYWVYILVVEVAKFLWPTNAKAGFPSGLHITIGPLLLLYYSLLFERDPQPASRRSTTNRKKIDIFERSHLQRVRESTGTPPKLITARTVATPVIS